MTVFAWVGLGANLGNPVSSVREALAALTQIEGCRLCQHSSLYCTKPFGPDVEGQPDYINAVAQLETSLTASELLQALFAVEEHFGRERSTRNAARTLDLDLLLYGDECIKRPDLSVPHPRMHERAFVLGPLTELAPTTIVPGHGTVAHLFATLNDQGIRRLPD